MITLDAATVLLQWAVGGLFFLWVTTRRREVGIGYGWTMRITFGLMAAGAVVVGLVVDPVPVREAFGAGVEAHEHPNIVEGNDLPLVAGHAFSVEPGIYVPGVWGARLEDIVVATDDGPDPLNLIDHGLAVVDG